MSSVNLHFLWFNGDLMNTQSWKTPQILACVTVFEENSKRRQKKNTIFWVYLELPKYPHPKYYGDHMYTYLVNFSQYWSI